MSWSISIEGKREDVAGLVMESFGNCIKQSGGDPKFIHEYETARAAVLAVVNATPGEELALETHGHYSFDAVKPIYGKFFLSVEAKYKEPNAQ